MRQITLAASAIMVMAASSAPTQPQCVGTSKTFTVTASGFIDPSGNAWTAHGVNMGPTDGLQNLIGIENNYPGLTMVRLVCNAAVDTPESIAPVILQYTGKGIVVEIEDHNDTQSGDNTDWYSKMAALYKSNALVFLETPNEPGDNNTAQHQIDIIKAIRATGFNNPIGVQPMGGYDQSNIPAVTAAVGTTNLYVTPHIYFTPWQQTAIDTARSNGLFSVIDEFGNAGDGVTIDPQGDAVIQGVIQANKAGKAGAIFWAVDNGYHPDGADSAFMDPTGTQLTSTGKELQPWLSSSQTQGSCSLVQQTSAPSAATQATLDPLQQQIDNLTQSANDLLSKATQPSVPVAQAGPTSQASPAAQRVQSILGGTQPTGAAAPMVSTQLPAQALQSAEQDLQAVLQQLQQLQATGIQAPSSSPSAVPETNNASSPAALTTGSQSTTGVGQQKFQPSGPNGDKDSDGDNDADNQ